MKELIKRGVSRALLAIAGLAMACVAGEDRGGAAKLPAPPQAVQEKRLASDYFLATDGSTYQAGATINVAWAAPSTHSSMDWVGLYKVGDSDAAYLSKKYVPAGSSGMLTFSAPVRSGTYELRYVPGTGTTSYSTSNPFTVSLTAGNIFLFSNSEGGTYTLVVDQDLPNIQIGIVSLAPSIVTLTGPYVGNVSTVLVSGYSTMSTVKGIDASKAQQDLQAPVTRQQAYADNEIVCADGIRIKSYSNWGCNSSTQIEEYFLSKFGEVSVLSHMTRNNAFSGTIPLSAARLNMVVVRDTTHFNVAAAAGQPTGAVKITVDVNATIGSASTLAPAFTTGSLGSGSTVQINNYADIKGAGGSGGSGGNGGGGAYPRTCSRDGLPGGPAIVLTVPTTINNRGNIWGGGGGGGGGSGCNANAGGGGGAGYVGGAGGAGASSLSNVDELAFCGQDNGVRTGAAGNAGGETGGEGGKTGEFGGLGPGSYDMLGGNGGGYGQPGQPPDACVFASRGGAAGAAIKRNGNSVNIPDGAYDIGFGRIRGPVLP